MASDDGGPAFPQVQPGYPGACFYEGMAVRDEFAKAALTGMLAHATRYKPRKGASSNWHEAIAQEAYQLADAMLAERETTNDPR